MGTLYDLLGALPGDDAEGLRAAFRRAAKAAHPDINPDDPDAARRFRELLRAYDILTDGEQRATYDELLSIALRPPATKATHVYENMRKFASNTMAASLIAGVLIVGYTLFPHLARKTDAAEITAGMTAAAATEIAAVEPAPQPDTTGPAEPRVQKDGAEPASEAMVTAAASPAGNEAGIQLIGSFDPAPGFTMSHLVFQHDPRFVEAYVDRGIVLYRMREFDGAFAAIAPAKHMMNASRSRISAVAPRKTSPVRVRVAIPVRRLPMAANFMQ